MQHSEAIDKIIPAFIAAQAAIAPAKKDADNTHFKAKYADLESVWGAIHKPFADNKLAFTQDVAFADGVVSVTTRIWHESAQWIEFGPLRVPPFKPDAHGIGSSTTYGRRFGLCSAVGIVAGEDDDGNAASGYEGGKPAKKFMDKMATLPKDEPPKSPPGISVAREKCNAACAEIEAGGDWDAVSAYLNGAETKKLAVSLCRDFPSLWRGTEPGSGLAGRIEVAGDQCQATGDNTAVADAKAYIQKVEEAARKA